MGFGFTHCVSSVDHLNLAKYQELSIGLEIQEFAFSQNLDGNWRQGLTVFRNALTDFNGIIAVHGSYTDLNPGSPDRRIRAVTKYRYQQAIEVAQVLDADYVIFHSQVNPFIKEAAVQQIKALRQKEFWDDLVQELESMRTTILLENFAENPCDLLQLLKAIDMPRIKICFDIGHALFTSSLAIAEWIEILKEHLEYIHLHWNDTSFDAHLAPPDEFAAEFLSSLC